MKGLLRIAGIFLLGAGVGYGVAEVRRHQRDAGRPVATAAVFQDVLRAIRADFVDSLTDEELYVKAAEGVVKTLGDPYSAFLGPEAFRGYTDMLKGRGTTLGVSFRAGLTGLVVADVVPGTPAEAAGVKPGDFVVEIGGHPAARLAVPAAMAALRPDSTGTTALRLLTPGDSVALEVHLTPERGALPAVHSAVRLSDSVGYFALRTVSDNASSEVRAALARLRAWELNSLVIDLRGNRGGRLDEGLAIADIFLPEGKRIGTVARRRSRWGYASARPEAYPRLALTLLVDRETASSAEIIAAALRDNDRARLVGVRTWGKGLIQTTIPLGDSVAIRLTTGRWQGPGGRLIAGGIEPDSLVLTPEWEASLLRALAPRMDVVSATLDGLAARRLAGGVAADSTVLTRAELESLRTGIRQAGLPLSRATMGVHKPLFDRELARLVATRSGDHDQAVRFGLLTDPWVQAALTVGANTRAPAGPH